MFLQKWFNEWQRHHTQVEERMKIMSTEFEALTAAVTQLSQSVQAAVARINALTAAAEDPAAVQALTEQVNAASAELTAVLHPASTPAG